MKKIFSLQKSKNTRFQMCKEGIFTHKRLIINNIVKHKTCENKGNNLFAFKL